MAARRAAKERTKAKTKESTPPVKMPAVATSDVGRRVLILIYMLMTSHELKYQPRQQQAAHIVQLYGIVCTPDCSQTYGCPMANSKKITSSFCESRFGNLCVSLIQDKKAANMSERAPKAASVDSAGYAIPQASDLDSAG